jgi:DNA-binding winged helix-turn-helix (wHTH) protein
MEDGKNRFYGFGKFRVDTRRRILSKNGETISLSPRNFDLLLVMIENEGQILSHDDLLDKVWEGTFVEQANLKNAISVLRRVLGEVPNEALYIRTVPRRGYSFVAPVEVLPDGHAAETLLYEETVSEFTIGEEVESEDEIRGTFIREASKTLPMPTVPAQYPWCDCLAERELFSLCND